MRVKLTPYRRFSSNCLPENNIRLSQSFLDYLNKKKMESSQQKWIEDLDLENWEATGDEVATRSKSVDSGFHSQDDLSLAPKRNPVSLPRRDRLMNIVNMSDQDKEELCPERTIDGNRHFKS